MRKKSTTLFPMWGSQPKSKYTCKYSYTRALCESFVIGASIGLNLNMIRIWNGFCAKHMQKWLVQPKMLCWLKYLYPLTRQVDLFHGNGGCLFALVCMWPRHQPATPPPQSFFHRQRCSFCLRIEFLHSHEIQTILHALNACLLAI